jgi:hypothetical protein
MSTTYTQTDTSTAYADGCWGGTTGNTTAGRECTVGGTAGTTEVTVAPRVVNGANTNDGVFVLRCEKPGFSDWAAGDWVVTYNVTSQDAGNTIDEVHVCDQWDDGTPTYTTVVTQTAIAQGGVGTFGYTLNTIVGHVAQDQTDSRPFVVLVVQNTDDHGNADMGITPGETVVAPYGTDPEPAGGERRIILIS